MPGYSTTDISSTSSAVTAPSSDVITTSASEYTPQETIPAYGQTTEHASESISEYQPSSAIPSSYVPEETTPAEETYPAEETTPIEETAPAYPSSSDVASSTESSPETPDETAPVYEVPETTAPASSSVPSSYKSESTPVAEQPSSYEQSSTEGSPEAPSAPAYPSVSVPYGTGSAPAYSPSFTGAIPVYSQKPSASSAPVVSSTPATEGSPVPESSSPAYPEPSCPGVLPKCLKTWLHVTECKDNSDSDCFCKNDELIKNVHECLPAWASDEEASAAASYLMGLCAPHIPENPG